MLLLLSLLEGAATTYSRSALVEFHGDKGAVLIQSGLVKPSGTTRLRHTDSDGGLLVDVDYDQDRRAFSYIDPERGWVEADADAGQLYRPDIRALCSHLLSNDLKPLPHMATQLAPDFCFEVGHVRLGQAKLTSVWFARRLAHHNAAAALASAHADRPDSQVRLVLTSTGSTHLLPVNADMVRIVSIADVLSHEAGVIDIDMLKLRFFRETPRAMGEAVHLSDDGHTLTIDGKHELTFRSEMHVAIIRKIVEAYRANKSLVASALLGSVASESRTFAQAFGPKWKLLKRFMHNEAGRWRLRP